MAEPWDVNGRQGAVDAMLTLPDGRTAALEVMSYDENHAIRSTSSWAPTTTSGR